MFTPATVLRHKLKEEKEESGGDKGKLKKSLNEGGQLKSKTGENVS